MHVHVHGPHLEHEDGGKVKHNENKIDKDEHPAAQPELEDGGDGREAIDEQRDCGGGVGEEEGGTRLWTDACRGDRLGGQRSEVQVRDSGQRFRVQVWGVGCEVWGVGCEV